MRRLLLILVWAILPATIQAQTVECVGTESSPSQLTSCGSATKYAYKVTAGLNQVDTVMIGTHDGNPNNYTNICKPPGWTFAIESAVPTPLFTPYDHRPKTAHGTVTAALGLCPYMIKLRGESNPIAPLTSYTFGFDNVRQPHDVEWRVSGAQYANWGQPVGGGPGPVHAPDSCQCFADGDINGDGNALAVADLVALSRFILGTGPAPIPLCRADMNGDGFIDEGDVEIMNCYFTHGISCFPVFPVPTICNPDTLRGACCEVDTCHIRSEYNCQLRHGTYFGDGSACTPNFCWGEVCGTKFNDLNYNGVQDLGEPLLNGVTITLLPPVPSAPPVVTGPNGMWCFGPVPAGQYTVHENIPGGMIQTWPPAGYFTINILPQVGILGGAFGNADTCTGPTTTVIQLAGNKDNFLLPVEPSSPSAALSATYTCPAGAKDLFDFGLFEQCLGHTFTGFKQPDCLVEHAQLCFKIEGRENPSGTIKFLANSGSGLVPIWTVSLASLDPTPPFNWFDTYDRCLDLAQLPPGVGNGTTNVISALQYGDFNVKFEADSVLVDFLELTVQVCCPCVPPPDSMVAWWPLDEPNGSDKVIDLAGFANDGVPKPGGLLGSPNGPNATTGFVAGALSLSSVSLTGPYIEVPDHPEVNIVTNFSIDAWVNLSSQASIFDQPILDKCIRSNPQPLGYALDAISWGPAGSRLQFDMGDGSSSVSYISSPATLIPANTWSHIAVTVSRNSGTVLFYLNGTQLSPPPGIMPSGSFINTLPLLIGESRLVGAIQAPLMLDEIELFNHVLSQAEILSIVNAGPAGKCKPCCHCPHQGDINGDGVIDVFDVIALIGITFTGDLDPQDPCCPITRGDVNNDGVVDVFDVIYLIGTAFGGTANPVNPCP